MLRPRCAMCLRRRLLLVIRAKVGNALHRSAAADALPLKAALLHLDADFELHRLSHGPGDAAVSRPATRRVLVVQPGRDSRARSGACSVYESDSAGALADRRESDDRQAPRGRTVRASVVPAFMPKQNSALVGTAAERSNDAPRPEIGEPEGNSRPPVLDPLSCRGAAPALAHATISLAGRKPQRRRDGRVGGGAFPSASLDAAYGWRREVHVSSYRRSPCSRSSARAALESGTLAPSRRLIGSCQPQAEGSNFPLLLCRSARVNQSGRGLVCDGRR